MNGEWNKELNYLTKTCPHCKVQLRSSGAAYELVKKGAVNSDTSSGIPVTLYDCPKCGYMELYNLRITTRI